MSLYHRRRDRFGTCDIVMSSNGIDLDNVKVDLIVSLPYGSNIKDIHSFLGYACFYPRDKGFFKDCVRFNLCIYF